MAHSGSLSMTRVVFDSTLLLSAVVNRNTISRACWVLVEEGFVEHAISNETMTELERVIRHDDIQKRIRFNDQQADRFLEHVRQLSQWWSKPADCGISVRDANDQPFLNLAIASDSEFLVTSDKDLLAIGSDRLPSSLKIIKPHVFRAEVGIRIGY
jgi:putative PIN family toxin of toxin-antitoxin system